MTNGDGKYIYAIINAKEPTGFESVGIGGRGDKVYTIHYDDLAAVVSPSPVVKYPVMRDHVMAHQKVLEEVLQRYTLLPVRFCTIANEEEAIIERVLKGRYSEFIDLLREMEGKIEHGVRAFWTDMNAIFLEIIEKNKEIKVLKEALLSEKSEQRKYAGSIKVGQMVKKALEEKKKKEADELLEILRALSLDYRENRVLGDMNLLNAAFLIAKERDQEFDRKIEELEKVYGERKKLKYIGPVPPCNFVEVRVTW